MLTEYKFVLLYLVIFTEGRIASPTSNALISVNIANMKPLNDATYSVSIGINTSISKGDSTDMGGVPLGNISLELPIGEPNNQNNEKDRLEMTIAGQEVNCTSNLRLCRKGNANMANNDCDCGTKATGYNWEPRTGSCYKFHRVAKPWHPAAMACTAEGGHLAIINSIMESEVLKDLFEKNFDGRDKASVGFWNWNQKVWLTVFGETLCMAGYDVWNNGEPNNSGGHEFCGSIHQNGQLNDFACDNTIPFICEITPYS